MSTLRQREANRRNAQKSTGPTSVTGKAASSMNALKTGLHAKSLVLPSENLADFDQLVDEYYLRHPPATPEARCLVDDLIRCEWTLRRIDAAEAQTWIYQTTSSYREAEKYPLGKSATILPQSPSPNSSTASIPLAAPSTAPSRPSNNSRPKPPPRPLPPQSSNAETRRP